MAETSQHHERTSYSLIVQRYLSVKHGVLATPVAVSLLPEEAKRSCKWPDTIEKRYRYIASPLKCKHTAINIPRSVAGVDLRLAGNVSYRMLPPYTSIHGDWLHYSSSMNEWLDWLPDRNESISQSIHTTHLLRHLQWNTPSSLHSPTMTLGVRIPTILLIVLHNNTRQLYITKLYTIHTLRLHDYLTWQHKLL